jgi:predicted transcriptional regulator
MTLEAGRGEEAEVLWRCVVGSSGFVKGLESDEDVMEVVADRLDPLSFYTAGYRTPSPSHRKTDRGDLTRLTLLRFLAMTYAQPIPFNLVLPFLSGRKEIWTPLAKRVATLILPLTPLAVSSALSMAGRGEKIKARSAYIVLTALKRRLERGEAGFFSEEEAAPVLQGEEAAHLPTLMAALEPIARDPGLTPDEVRERLLERTEEVLEILGIPSYRPRVPGLGPLRIPVRRGLAISLLTGDLGETVQRLYVGLRAGHIRAVQRVLALAERKEGESLEWWWGFLNRERFRRALSHYNPFGMEIVEAIHGSPEFTDEEKPLVFLRRFYEGWESTIEDRERRSRP